MSSIKKTLGLTAEESLLGTTFGRRLSEQLPLKGTRPDIRPADYQEYGTKDLVLARHWGAFIKPCPGTPEYICCGLQIVHFGLGCRLDCSYCILQGYLDSEALVVFGNVEEGLEKLRDIPAEPNPAFKRYCTGEFTDSLLLEDLTGLGAELVKIFAKSKNVLLELKTKTINIDSLLDLDHQGRTVLSFSVNAPEVARNEERRAVPVARRIEAASRGVKAGYRVAFHFDPLIRHQGWEEGYRQTVNEIYDVIPPDRIAWISLGAFRYLPGLKEIVRRRHPQSRIMDDEFILAADGKMRYLRPRRVEMYRTVLSAIRARDPEACVYMCMESPRVWQEVFGFVPGPGGLVEMLDRRV